MYLQYVLFVFSGYSGSKILGLMQMSSGSPSSTPHNTVGGTTGLPPPNLHVPNNHGFNDLLSDVTTHPHHKHNNPHRQVSPSCYRWVKDEITLRESERDFYLCRSSL